MKGKVVCVALIVLVVMTGTALAVEAPNYGTKITNQKIAVWGADWSPDGKWITYMNVGSNELWLVSAEGGEPVNIAKDLSLGKVWFPSFTSDSKEVSFCNFGSVRNVESINIETGEKTVVVENAGHPSWSHNGRYLSYIKDGNPTKHAVYDKETGNSWELADDLGWAPSCFSHDDQYVITGLPDGNLYKIPVEGGEPVQLTFEKGAVFFPQCSPDGKWITYLYYTVSKFGGNKLVEMRVLNTETGESKRLFPPNVECYCGVFSPDGGKIAYNRYIPKVGGRDIWITDFQPEKSWNYHFTVIPYETGALSKIEIPPEKVPTIDGEPLEPGDEIGIFTPRGVCAGMGVWADEFMEIFVWGDNTSEEGTLGFLRDEPFTYKIWDTSARKEYLAEGTYSSKYTTYLNNMTFTLTALTSSEPTGVNEGDTPLAFRLFQNTPNPFNPVTTIRYQLKHSGMVNLVIYDLLGRKVTTLVDGMQSPGSYSVTWNAEGYASGMYFYRIELGGSKVMTQKMMLVK